MEQASVRKYVVRIHTQGGKFVLPSPEGLPLEPTGPHEKGKKLPVDSLPTWAVLEVVYGQHAVRAEVVGLEVELPALM